MNTKRKIRLFSALTTSAVLTYKAYKWYKKRKSTKVDCDTCLRPEEKKKALKAKLWEDYTDDLANRINNLRPMTDTSCAIQKVGTMARNIPQVLNTNSTVIDIMKEHMMGNIINAYRIKHHSKLTNKQWIEEGELYAILIQEFSSAQTEEDIRRIASQINLDGLFDSEEPKDKSTLKIKTPKQEDDKDTSNESFMSKPPEGDVKSEFQSVSGIVETDETSEEK